MCVCVASDGKSVGFDSVLYLLTRVRNDIGIVLLLLLLLILGRLKKRVDCDVDDRKGLAREREKKGERWTERERERECRVCLLCCIGNIRVFVVRITIY